MLTGQWKCGEREVPDSHGNNGTVAALVCRRGAERESGVSIATTPRAVPLEMPNKGTQPSLKPQKRRTRRMESNRRFNGYEGAPPPPQICDKQRTLLPCRSTQKGQRLTEPTLNKKYAEIGGPRPKGANSTSRRNCRGCKR